MQLLSLLLRWSLAALLAGLLLARPIGMVVDLHRGTALQAVLGSLALAPPERAAASASRVPAETGEAAARDAAGAGALALARRAAGPGRPGAPPPGLGPGMP